MTAFLPRIGVSNGGVGYFVNLLDRINRMIRISFVCIFNFQTKLKIPNRFAKGES